MEDKQLRVVLDHPNLPYRPGDVLKGTVSLADGFECEHVQVSLIGVAMHVTFASEKVTFLEEFSAMLIAREYNLTVPDSRSLPFEVPIPSLTEEANNIFADPIKLGPGTAFKASFGLKYAINRFDAFHFLAKVKDRNPKTLDCFENEVGHPLPPTFPPSSYQEHRHIQYFPYIEYVVVAKAMQRNAANELYSSNQDDTPVWVTANCPSPETVTQLTKGKSQQRREWRFLVKSKNILAERPSFKEGLKMKLRPSLIPLFRFDIAVSIPTYVHVGDIIPLQFEITPDAQPAGQTGIIQPELQLHSVIIKLERQVSVSSLHVRQAKKVVAAEYSDRPLKFRDSGSGYTGPILDIGAVIFNSDVIPDFATYHICISHLLKLEVVLESSGQAQTQNLEAPIKIFSRRRLNSESSQATGFVEGPQDVNEDWGPCSPSVALHKGQDMRRMLVLSVEARDRLVTGGVATNRLASAGEAMDALNLGVSSAGLGAGI